MAPSALVVEQDREMREALSGFLRDRGYSVHAVPSRSEGFDYLDGEAPDLLVLDDPARQRAYRFVWLREGTQDVRVQLVDIQPERIGAQLEALLGMSPARG